MSQKVTKGRDSKPVTWSFIFLLKKSDDIFLDTVVLSEYDEIFFNLYFWSFAW